jgi:hypothetical protein
VQRAGAAAGAKRIVVVSIIGIDTFHGGDNAAKVAQEQTARRTPRPMRRAQRCPTRGAQLAGPSFAEWPTAA